MDVYKTEEIEGIVKLLKEDKVVALPTDTVYGFSCLATSDIAVKKIYDMKQRDEQKAFIILLSKKYNLSELIEDKDTISVIQNNTPAPVTFVVNKATNFKISKYFTLPTLAIRVPDNDFLQGILEHVGYMVSTSCNIQGEPNINECSLIQETFPMLDGIVDFNYLKNSPPSTIVDLTNKPYKIIRQGDFVFKV